MSGSTCAGRKEQREDNERTISTFSRFLGRSDPSRPALSTHNVLERKGADTESENSQLPIDVGRFSSPIHIIIVVNVERGGVSHVEMPSPGC